MNLTQDVKNVQKMAWKLFAILRTLHGTGNARVKRIPMAGLSHFVQIHRIIVGGTHYAIGFHPDRYVNSFIFFDCADPELCIDRNPVVLRIDTGKVVGSGQNCRYKSKLYYHLSTETDLPPMKAEEKNPFSKREQEDHIDWVLSIIFGQIKNVKFHYDNPKPREVSLEDCRVYEPFIEESNEPVKQLQNFF